MSGGRFNFQQIALMDMADQIDRLIDSNEHGFSDAALAEFQQAVRLLREAYVFVQRIDWLLSGDDGEDSFFSRLESELCQLTESENQ